MSRNKIKGKLTEKGLTYKECAEAIGVSVTTFNKKINGTAKFYVEEVIALSDFIGLTLEERIEIFLK